MHVHHTPQRFSRNTVCPICGGHDNLPRGVGRRCAGFLSSDGRYIHCSREEHAGGLPLVESSGTYAHRAAGPCRCGVQHAPEAEPQREITSRVVATYDYRDAAGTLVFQVVRRDPKGFTQRRPDGRGGWIWSVAGVELPLYRTPDLVARPRERVYLCEGEKDADALARLGLLATCNAMGAGKWQRAYTERLAGRDVVILCDSDPAGRAHGERVAEILAGRAASVRVLDLAPDKADGHDVSDWLGAGNTRVDLEALAERVVPWKAAAAGEGGERPEPFDWRKHVRPLRELMAKQFAPATWVIPGTIPGGSTLIAGAPKTGKSLLGWQIALARSLGGKALGTVDVERTDVLYLLLEDSERLTQKRVAQMLQRTGTPENFDYSTVWAPLAEGGVEALRDYLGAHPACRLVVIDTFEPLRAADRSGQNAYRNDYQGLRPLTQLAHETGVDIVIVHHTSKVERADVFATVNGSYGLNGAVDNVAVLTRVRFGPEVVLSVSGRDLDEDLQLALSYDKATYTHTLLGNADEVGKTRLQRAIVEVLRKAAEPLQARDIADELGRANDSSLRHILANLVRRGVALIVGRGRYRAAPPGAKTCDCEETCDQRDQCDLRSGADPAAAPPEPGDGAIDHIDHVDHKSQILPMTAVPCTSCGKRYAFKPAPLDPEVLICSHCGVNAPPSAYPSATRDEDDEDRF